MKDTSLTAFTDSSPPTTQRNISTNQITTDDRLAAIIIRDQSSSIPEAAREGQQNGIDKPSSSLVATELTPRKLTIWDDGDPTDFNNSNEEQLITRLGLSSKDVDDDDTIGRFGIGIGQLLRTGLVTIMSGDWALTFDINLVGNKHRINPFESELDYAKVPLEHYVDGVRIVVSFYEDEVPSPNSFRWNRYESQIKKQLTYITFIHDTEVTFNGDVIDGGHPFDTVNGKYHLTTETESAYFAVEHNSDDQIQVYSNGMFVTEIPGEGLSGTIVSKGNLDLDLARNGIKDGCERWDCISDTLTELRGEILTAVPDSKLTRDARTAMANMMSTDEEYLDRWSDRNVFRLVNDDCASLDDIQTREEIGWAKQNRAGSGQLIDDGDIILSESDDANEVIQSEPRTLSAPVETFDVEERAKEKGIDTGFSEVEREGELRPKWRRRLLFARLLATKLHMSRDIKWGESDEVDAWTDGATHITLTESAVDRGRFDEWSTQVLFTLLEMDAYDCDSRENSFGVVMNDKLAEAVRNNTTTDRFYDLCEEARERGFTELFQYYGIHERL